MLQAKGPQALTIQWPGFWHVGLVLVLHRHVPLFWCSKEKDSQGDAKFLDSFIDHKRLCCHARMSKRSTQTFTNVIVLFVKQNTKNMREGSSTVGSPLIPFHGPKHAPTSPTAWRWNSICLCFNSSVHPGTWGWTSRANRSDIHWLHYLCYLTVCFYFINYCHISNSRRHSWNYELSNQKDLQNCTYDHLDWYALSLPLSNFDCTKFWYYIAFIEIIWDHRCSKGYF